MTATAEKEIKTQPINKAIKEEFINLKCKVEDYKTVEKYEHWKKYYNKSIENVFKISDTEYYPLDKPYIKTSFCFGYGYCLQSTEEESNSAFECSRQAREDVTFFINENLEDINHKIAVIEYYLLPVEDWKAREDYFNTCYNNNTMRYGEQMNTPYICSFYEDMRGVEVKLSYFNEIRDENIISQPYVLRKATHEELEIIHENLIQFRLRLIKRLNTYLKKYGLNHITSWTYLRD